MKNEETMDIRSPKGTEVVFQRSSKEMVQWGSHDNPDGILVIGQTYTVDHTEPHSTHTKVYLQEVPGKEFNSCSFSAAPVHPDRKHNASAKKLFASMVVSGTPRPGVFSIEGATETGGGILYMHIDGGETPEFWTRWKFAATWGKNGRLLDKPVNATITSVVFLPEETKAPDIKASISVSFELDEESLQQLQHRLNVESRVPVWFYEFVTASYLADSNPLPTLRQLLGGIWKFERGDKRGDFSSVYWDGIKVWESRATTVPVDTTASDDTMRHIEETSLGPIIVRNR
jgi:hypothetical protein